MAYIGTSGADKGGTGKTTTEINLASCLAYRGLDTLLIDYTHQGNTTYGVGITEYEHTVGDALEGRVSLEEVIVQPYPDTLPKLWVAPSDHSLFRVADNYNYSKDPFLLARIIRPIVHRFDHIRIDIPGSVLGFQAVTALTACDSVSIVVQPGPFEIRGAKNLVQVLREIKKLANPRVRLMKILLTQVRKTVIASKIERYFKETYSSIEEEEGEENIGKMLAELYEYGELGATTNPLFKVQIRQNAMFQWDQTLGVPAVLNAKNRWGRQDYLQFTAEYLKLCALKPAGKLRVSWEDQEQALDMAP